MNAHTHERSSKCGFNIDLENHMPRKGDRVVPKINHRFLGDMQYNATFALVEPDGVQMFDFSDLQ